MEKTSPDKEVKPKRASSKGRYKEVKL